MSITQLYASTTRFISEQVAQNGLTPPAAVILMEAHGSRGPIEQIRVRLRTLEQFMAWATLLGWTVEHDPGLFAHHYAATGPDGWVDEAAPHVVLTCSVPVLVKAAV